jgi:XTP/dITP diphosphohydrolase
MTPTEKRKIALATTNAGKIREFTALFAKLPYSFVDQTQLGIASCEETGLTFVENAIIKARHLATHWQLPVIADDTGLVIDALHGRPGVYSARYAGPSAISQDNVAKVLQEMQNVPQEQRTAHFCCVIVYLRDAEDPAPLICQGRWDGAILTEARGSNGFGYDPIFFVPSHACAAAELSLEVKNNISHRATAMRQLVDEMSRF